ncbi:hypothetical protein BDZ88DRAFT_455941 [Geranomyces variabilis]|nr:hypothetical protein BDZ88DRAFT_455941 [Geranomyces variabilis]KAJ3140136.1 hypothetical protein HDU90_008360 [Geranomyces variabilis]
MALVVSRKGQNRRKDYLLRVKLTKGTQAALANVLGCLFSTLRLQRPTREVHEASWCMQLVAPYFHFQTDPDLCWTYDNTTAYGRNRPDFHVTTNHDTRKFGLALVEVKSARATDAQKAADIGRVLRNGIEQIKRDLRSWQNASGASPAKKSQESVFASAVAMATAISQKVRWLKNQALTYTRTKNVGVASNTLCGRYACGGALPVLHSAGIIPMPAVVTMPAALAGFLVLLVLDRRICIKALHVRCLFAAAHPSGATLPTLSSFSPIPMSNISGLKPPTTARHLDRGRYRIKVAIGDDTAARIRGPVAIRNVERVLPRRQPAARPTFTRHRYPDDPKRSHGCSSLQLRLEDDTVVSVVPDEHTVLSVHPTIPADSGLPSRAKFTIVGARVDNILNESQHRKMQENGLVVMGKGSGARRPEFGPAIAELKKTALKATCAGRSRYAHN